MNILHIVPSYKPAYVYGGPIESIARLCEGLVKAGHTTHVYTTTANGKSELNVAVGKQVDVDGVKVIYFKRKTKDHTHISPALWKHLYKHCQEYDAIHIHSWWSILIVVAAWICHMKKVKTIIAPRGMLSKYIFSATHSGTKKWIHQLIGEKVLSKGYFHATAQSEYEECSQLIPGWKGFLLPNILLLPEVEIFKEFNKEFTLIFLSRVHPKKGLELLFEAISQLPFSPKLKIAGTGEDSYLLELKKKADSLGISGQVEWLGWKNREEKFLELMESDLFVLTSYNENFANVVIESLHVGTPVLISEQVGLAPFVQENQLGWVTALQVNSIRKSLIEAYHDTFKREFIHKNGRSIIANSFSQTILIQNYIETYNKVAKQNI